MKGFGLQLNDSGSGEAMDLKIDPKRDVDGKIISGLVLGNTLEQNKALILLAQPGDFKFRPDLGVGIEDLLLSENYLEFRHRIREHLAKDGMRVEVLELYKNKPVKIEANYDN